MLRIGWLVMDDGFDEFRIRIVNEFVVEGGHESLERMPEKDESEHGIVVFVFVAFPHLDRVLTEDGTM